MRIAPGRCERRKPATEGIGGRRELLTFQRRLPLFEGRINIAEPLAVREAEGSCRQQDRRRHAPQNEAARQRGRASPAPFRQRSTRLRLGTPSSGRLLKCRRRSLASPAASL